MKRHFTKKIKKIAVSGILPEAAYFIFLYDFIGGLL